MNGRWSNAAASTAFLASMASRAKRAFCCSSSLWLRRFLADGKRKIGVCSPFHAIDEVKFERPFGRSSNLRCCIRRWQHCLIIARVVDDLNKAIVLDATAQCGVYNDGVLRPTNPIPSTSFRSVLIRSLGVRVDVIELRIDVVGAHPYRFVWMGFTPRWSNSKRRIQTVEMP